MHNVPFYITVHLGFILKQPETSSVHKKHKNKVGRHLIQIRHKKASCYTL